MYLILILSVLVQLLVLPQPVIAEEIRFKHALSFYFDDKGGGMKQPGGVACAGSDLFVADTANSRLLRYALADGSIKSVSELTAAELSLPALVRINSKKTLYVLETRENRVYYLRSPGEAMVPLDISGIPPPETIILRSLAIGPNDDLYLLDIASARVLVATEAGAYKKSVPFPKDYGFFSDIAVDRKGTIYLVDSTKSAVYSTGKDPAAFTLLAGDLNGQLQVGFPVAIAVDARERIYLVDRNNANLIVLGRDGSFLARQLGRGWAEGLLRYPVQLCLGENGEVFVADRGNNRVQMFVPMQ